jgi:hypothetical protein
MSGCNGHRWSKFWWADHQGDPKLGPCSLAARGLWMELLCIMHSATPAGYLLINDKQPTNAKLALIARCSGRQLVKLLQELGDAGVYYKTAEGTIYCKRMVKDAEATEMGRDSADKRWKTKETTPKDPNGSPNNIPNEKPTDQPYSQAYRSPNKEPNAKKLEAEEEARKKGKHTPLTPLISPTFATTLSPPVPGGGVREPPGFAEFWSNYPRKVGRRTAATAFLAALKRGATPDDILDGLDRAQFQPDERYQPHPATWLNGERWRDERDPIDPVLRVFGLVPEDCDGELAVMHRAMLQ